MYAVCNANGLEITLVATTYVLESLTSSTRRSNACRVGVAVEVVEDVLYFLSGLKGRTLG